MRRPPVVTAGASLLVLGFSASLSLRAAAQVDAGAPDADIDAALDGSAPGAGKPGAGSDLAQMGRRLLDPADLVTMGSHLLDEPAKPVRAGAKASVVDASAIADPAVLAAEAGLEAALAAGDAAVEPDAGPIVEPPDASPVAVASAAPSSSPPDERTPGPGGKGFGHGGGGPRRDVLPNKGAAESPLAKLGIPVQAVPAVATVASTGLLAIWPALSKTIMGLFKSFVASRLKNRAKKDQKVDRAMRALNLFGISVRPAELGAICIAALVYGLAVCYGFQGWKMKGVFVLQQEALVLVIYYARSIVRFVYERAYKLTTQYRFWVMGGFLCLGSAYLGTTLGTVGYELEASNSKEDATRIVKMKGVLIAVALAMALGFFAANLANPTKLLQSGRVMMSGAALAEILPVTPMPGRKIYDWNKGAWFTLFALVVPTFFLINFVF